MPAAKLTAEQREMARLGAQTEADRSIALIQGVEVKEAPRDMWWDREETPPWHPMEDESLEWYTRFERFYLLQGPNRSIQSSYRLWVLSCGREIGVKGQRDVTNTWRENSAKYHWRERAFAYDGEINRRILLQVEQAGQMLRNAAPGAVAALINSLSHPRLAVAAAKEILDRAGLPAVSRQEIRTRMSFSTEDMEEAHAEVAEWEKRLLGESG